MLEAWSAVLWPSWSYCEIFARWDQDPPLSFAFQLCKVSGFLGFPVLLWDHEKQDHGLTPLKT